MDWSRRGEQLQHNRYDQPLYVSHYPCTRARITLYKIHKLTCAANIFQLHVKLLKRRNPPHTIWHSTCKQEQTFQDRAVSEGLGAQARCEPNLAPQCSTRRKRHSRHTRAKKERRYKSRKCFATRRQWSHTNTSNAGLTLMPEIAGWYAWYSTCIVSYSI